MDVPFRRSKKALSCEVSRGGGLLLAARGLWSRWLWCQRLPRPYSHSFMITQPHLDPGTPGSGPDAGWALHGLVWYYDSCHLGLLNCGSCRPVKNHAPTPQRRLSSETWGLGSSGLPPQPRPPVVNWPDFLSPEAWAFAIPLGPREEGATRLDAVTPHPHPNALSFVITTAF